MRILVTLVIATASFALSIPCSGTELDDELSQAEMKEFVEKAESNFVMEIGLPKEALDQMGRRDSLSSWIAEGTSYESVVAKLEQINASKGFSFRIIRDPSYVCIERTYYRKRNGMAISLMIVMDEQRRSSATSLSRSFYKLPISSS